MGKKTIINRFKTAISGRLQRWVMAHAFAGEFHAKYRLRAIEKGRSLTPWDSLTYVELFERMGEEKNELLLETRPVTPDGLRRMMDECKDVANFAWFMYEKAKAELKEGP